MKSATGSTTYLKALFVLMAFSDVKSTLIVRPKDADAVVGGTTFFNSSTSLGLAEVHWFHYAVGDNTERSFVYGYGQFYPPYLDRFQMEKNPASGAYNLVIPSVTIGDAGTYECQDATGRGDKGSAQLTVLDEAPKCQSSMKPDGLIGPNKCGFAPEELHLTCATQYHGNQAPIMQWREVGSDNPIEEGITRNISTNGAIYYLTVEVSSHVHGLSYQCVTPRSSTLQYHCTSDAVIVKGSDQVFMVIIICCVVGGSFLFLIGMLLGFRLGKLLRKRQSKQTESPDNTQHRDSGHDQIALIARKDIEQLRMDNERLATKVNELEQLKYNADVRPASEKVGCRLAHTIKIKATKSPITGMAILDNDLFVVSQSCPVIEVYDSKTFVFERLIEQKLFTNPVDIAASKEDKNLYIFNRMDADLSKSESVKVSESTIVKVSSTGGAGKGWVIENDYGRLSTYESNIVVCFSKKLTIVEYSSDSNKVNTVRLSPSNGFHNLWHALKLTGTHFAVSHGEVEDVQKVCVVDINGNVLRVFEKLPYLLFNKAYLPICLIEYRDGYVLVADAKNSRVLLLGSNLNYEGELIKTDSKLIPARLCVDETRDRVFVGVNSEYSKPESWKEGCILIYNILK